MTCASFRSRLPAASVWQSLSRDSVNIRLRAKLIRFHRNAFDIGTFTGERTEPCRCGVSTMCDSSTAPVIAQERRSHEEQEVDMRNIAGSLSIGVIVLAASAAFAHPGAGGGGMGAAPMAHTMSSPTTMRAQPASASPTHATGQPNAECGSATAPNTPGNAASAPGSAFNPSGVAGGKYAGQQPQNSNNPAAVSQYDAACAHQPH